MRVIHASQGWEPDSAARWRWLGEMRRTILVPFRIERLRHQLAVGILDGRGNEAGVLDFVPAGARDGPQRAWPGCWPLVPPDRAQTTRSGGYTAPLGI
jgi:hypothetical protein